VVWEASAGNVHANAEPTSGALEARSNRTLEEFQQVAVDASWPQT
jgi:hypothetical protein